MESKDFKYNYILYNMENGYKWQMYSELHGKDFIRMCKGALPMNEPILHKLHKFHWSAKVNSKIKLPFKKLWFKKMTNGKFKDNKPVCFVLYGGQYAVRDPRLCDYIKKLNPENKIALHYRDLIKSEAKHLDMLKDKTDIIYTYDQGDAEKYGIMHNAYYVYSKLKDTTTPEKFDYDLFFVGYAKDRLNLIHKVLKKAISEKISCKFIIVGVDKKDRLDVPQAEYLDGTIPYTEVINYIQKSKCILEISQENAKGMTMRTPEAILYKRKLLTNRVCIKDNPLYNSSHMSIFTDENNIDFDFLKSPVPYDEIIETDYFSPLTELKNLETYFSTGELFDKVKLNT